MASCQHKGFLCMVGVTPKMQNGVKTRLAGRHLRHCPTPWPFCATRCMHTEFVLVKKGPLVCVHALWRVRAACPETPETSLNQSNHMSEFLGIPFFAICVCFPEVQTVAWAMMFMGRWWLCFGHYVLVRLLTCSQWWHRIIRGVSYDMPPWLDMWLSWPRGQKEKLVYKKWLQARRVWLT